MPGLGAGRGRGDSKEASGSMWMWREPSRVDDMDGWESRDQCHARGEGDGTGRSGPQLYAVMQSAYCQTMWNRDVNAARNIGIVFWWLRTHGGTRPPGHRRIRRPSSHRGSLEAVP